MLVRNANEEGRLKKYKEKLKEWKCSKYIPKEKAHWMLGKAEQRKLPHPGHASGKDTVFSYGQQQWNVEKIRKITQRGKIDASETTALGRSFTTERFSY